MKKEKRHTDDINNIISEIINNAKFIYTLTPDYNFEGNFKPITKDNWSIIIEEIKKVLDEVLQYDNCFLLFKNNNIEFSIKPGDDKFPITLYVMNKKIIGNNNKSSLIIKYNPDINKSRYVISTSNGYLINTRMGNYELNTIIHCIINDICV